MNEGIKNTNPGAQEDMALIEAFKATLEEVVEADLILHLVDVSHPKAREQAEAVYRVLEEIGAKDKPIITAFNKIDKLADFSVIERLKTYFNNPIEISALKKEGLDILIHNILPYMSGLMTTLKMRIPSTDVNTLRLIYENGLVVRKDYEGGNVYVEAEVPLRVKGMIEKSYYIE